MRKVTAEMDGMGLVSWVYFFSSRCCCYIVIDAVGQGGFEITREMSFVFFGTPRRSEDKADYKCHLGIIL